MRHQPIIGLALAASRAISTDPPAGSTSTSTASLWERLSGYERQLLLALPDGTPGGRERLMPLLLDAVQAAHPSQVCVCTRSCMCGLSVLTGGCSVETGRLMKLTVCDVHVFGCLGGCVCVHHGVVQ